jgi:hypothetical protein
MEQLLVHIFGDYLTQSDYCAMNKSKRTLPCLIHVILYTLCFLVLTTSWKALLVIGGTHFILDRWPVIIKRLIWFKNHLGPHFVYPPFEKCGVTGYYDNIAHEAAGAPKNEEFVQEVYISDGPSSMGTGHATQIKYQPRLNYITMWLYIITDNFLHLTINYFALRYL